MVRDSLEHGIEATIVEATAPTIGTLAGTIVIEQGPGRLGVRREYVSAGAAATGLAIAFTSKGLMRATAISFAAQAIAHELLAMMKAATTAPPQRDAAAPKEPEGGFVTREDLEHAIRAMHEMREEALKASIRAAVNEAAPSLAPTS